MTMRYPKARWPTTSAQKPIFAARSHRFNFQSASYTPVLGLKSRGISLRRAFQSRYSKSAARAAPPPKAAAKIDQSITTSKLPLGCRRIVGLACSAERTGFPAHRYVASHTIDAEFWRVDEVKAYFSGKLAIGCPKILNIEPSIVAAMKLGQHRARHSNATSAIRVDLDIDLVVKGHSAATNRLPPCRRAIRAISINTADVRMIGGATAKADEVKCACNRSASSLCYHASPPLPYSRKERKMARRPHIGEGCPAAKTNEAMRAIMMDLSALYRSKGARPTRGSRQSARPSGRW